MKSIQKGLLVALLCVLCVFGFAACGNGEDKATANTKETEKVTLETYVKAHPDISKKFDGMLGDAATAEIKKNKVTYHVDVTSIMQETLGQEYTMTEEDKKLYWDTLDEEYAKIEPVMQQEIEALEKLTKASGITIEVNCLYKDEVIYTRTFQ